MNNVYHHELMVMLIKSGSDGLNVRQMARNIYNAHAGLFDDDIVFSEIYSQVRSYLWRQSHIQRSPITRLRWGRYAMKPDAAVQLDIFIDAPQAYPAVQEEFRPAPTPVVQLELFEDK